MLHKNVLNSIGSASPQQILESRQTPPQTAANAPASPVRLTLVPPGGGVIPKKSPPFLDLLAIAAHRCSSFFAEAAVLVLVLALRAASVLTEFSSRRWLHHH